jgi:hypothetical protein
VRARVRAASTRLRAAARPRPRLLGWLSAGQFAQDQCSPPWNAATAVARWGAPDRSAPWAGRCTARPASGGRAVDHHDGPETLRPRKQRSGDQVMLSLGSVVWRAHMAPSRRLRAATLHCCTGEHWLASTAASALRTQAARCGRGTRAGLGRRIGAPAPTSHRTCAQAARTGGGRAARRDAQRQAVPRTTHMGTPRAQLTRNMGLPAR